MVDIKLDVKQLSEVGTVAEGSFTIKQPPDIQGRGYVVKSLEAALWAFHNTSTFKDGCLSVGKDYKCIVLSHNEMCSESW